MIDIHCHLAYGVDDGSPTPEESLRMLEEAQKAGISVIIATPHLKDEIFRLEAFNKNLDWLSFKARDFNISILSGYEVLICSDVHALAEELTVITLNRSEYLLFEFPFSSLPVYGMDFVYRLRLDGIVPVIAHPERNDIFAGNIKLLYEYRTLGCMIQVDAGSISGKFGRKVKKCAKRLLKMDMVDFIASDAHSAFDYKKWYIRAYKRTIRWIGREKAYSLFNDNALQILCIKDGAEDVNKGSA